MNDTDRYRQHAEDCFAAAKIATATALAEAFERLANEWLLMAEDAKRRERLRRKQTVRH